MNKVKKAKVVDKAGLGAVEPVKEILEVKVKTVKAVKAVKAEPEVKAVKAKKANDKITLEEFWDETEKNPVRMNQLSKKLTEDLTKEEKKRLNYQDL